MKKILFFLLMAVTLGSCKDEPGPGGNARIEATAMHHDDAIPNAKIYIKYGQQESPGMDPSLYDDSLTADGNGLAVFEGLGTGEYYLRGVGFDPGINDSVFGGVPIEIRRKKETVATLVPVTE